MQKIMMMQPEKELLPSMGIMKREVYQKYNITTV